VDAAGAGVDAAGAGVDAAGAGVGAEGTGVEAGGAGIDAGGLGAEADGVVAVGKGADAGLSEDWSSGRTFCAGGGVCPSFCGSAWGCGSSSLPPPQALSSTHKIAEVINDFLIHIQAPVSFVVDNCKHIHIY
jgi:hypothetical protein